MPPPSNPPHAVTPSLRTLTTATAIVILLFPPSPFYNKTLGGDSGVTSGVARGGCRAEDSDTVFLTVAYAADCINRGLLLRL